MKRFFVVLALNLCYLTAASLSAVLCRLQKQKLNHGRIIVCVTIDNPNWFRAHIEPLAHSQHGEVIVVCDEPQAELPNLVYACPPSWMQSVFTRAGAKLITTLIQGWKNPSDLVMGYHLFPCAVIALVCARLLRIQAAYQVTSGVTELVGGGYGAENRLLRALGRHSDSVERAAKLISRQFDHMIVRGSSVQHYAKAFGYQGKLDILTGCIRVDSNEPLLATQALSEDAHPEKDSREIDVIFVGRLTEIKRLTTLLDAVAIVAAERPELKVSIVGDGPDRSELERQVDNSGTGGNVTFLGQRSDVYDLLRESKIFALTSRSESVSIAMLEAMSRGVVPVVTNVGDLADFVEDNHTGFVIEVGDVNALAEKITYLLEQPETRKAIGKRAEERVVARCSLEAIAEFWHEKLANLAH